MLNEVKEHFEYLDEFSTEVAIPKEHFEWLIEQAEEFERYKKYVMYFAGKDKVNDIRLAMQDRELD